MTDSYVLYKTDMCPFCSMVRRFLDARGIELPMRDTARDAAAHQELVAGGGRPTVPCLKITDAQGEVRWMYESMDIMRFLDAQYPN